MLCGPAANVSVAQILPPIPLLHKVCGPSLRRTGETTHTDAEVCGRMRAVDAQRSGFPDPGWRIIMIFQVSQGTVVNVPFTSQKSQRYPSWIDQLISFNSYTKPANFRYKGEEIPSHMSFMLTFCVSKKVRVPAFELQLRTAVTERAALVSMYIQLRFFFSGCHVSALDQKVM
jgi:hypothetical protein